ncbi:hypothetical protein [Streptomyces abikoensis]|uniref:hypothetical protein n=1 Tax=Streptomyces abikoensis TaxID=97398 RepID=UPI001671C502|nr:hypothetical protein [Streptomyces abikoensis]GGP40208.1 hypothetical protein GCM10010214_11990 [Streptomyces abikoensis]
MVPVVLAYVDALPMMWCRLLHHSRSDPDAPVRLGLLLASGRYAGDPRVSDHLRRRMREGDPAEALGAALGLALAPVPVTDDEVVEALTLCADEQAGAALAELAWGDPRWNGEPLPTAGFGAPLTCGAAGWRACWGGWGTGDGRLDPSAAPVLIEAADRLFKQGSRYREHAAAVADLLGHTDAEVRRAAVRTAISSPTTATPTPCWESWTTPAFRPGPALLRRKDPRCLPHLRERIRQGTLDCGVLQYAGNFADQLWPAIGARIADEDIPAAEVTALLTQARRWHAAGDRIAIPVATALERLNTRTDAIGNPEPDDHAAAREAAAFLRDWRARVVDEQSLEDRLARMRHTMGLFYAKDHDVVRRVLDPLIRRREPGHTPHPDDPRYDINACEWIGALPDAAQPAVATLRRLRDSTAEPGSLRAAAAHALWKITGEADGALTVLVEQVRHARLLVQDHLGSMGVAARPALPALRLRADDGDSDFALLARNAVRRIEEAS